MARWTRFVLRFRWPILAPWLAVILAGGYATSQISSLLSNTFTVPGTDSERVRTVLQQRFGDRSDGEFLIVYKLRPGAGRAGVSLALERSIREGAHAVPGGKATALRSAPGGVFYGSILTSLNLADAKGYTDDILRNVRPPPGVDAYVSGQPAIEHDLDPILSNDLAKGEGIALPIALLVLIAVFGLSFAATIPFLFAAASITGTIGIVFIVAHYLTMATYVTNLVQLIGLGIAIDYSLLIVYRFREEFARGGSKDDAILRTMATAGRAVIFSGATVAIGLALLLFMPLPFMRSMGLGGLLVPLFSIAASATFLPALLSVLGRKVNRFRVVPKRVLAARSEGRPGFWTRLSRSIMREGASSKPRRLEAGETLIVQGDPGDELYLLLDGVLAAEVDGETVAEIGPGAVLGERAIVEAGERTATLRAVTPCKIVSIASDQIEPSALEQLAGAHRREES